MVTFICLFFPALIALGFYEKILKSDLSVKKQIYMYALFNVGINMVCFFFKIYVFETGTLLLSASLPDMTPSIAFRYLVIAVAAALFLALLAALLTKHSDIRIEENLEDEKE